MALLSLARLAAGAVAGLVAGLVLHVILVGTGSLGALARAIPLGSTAAVAGAQLALSVLLGLSFAAFPERWSWGRALAWGLAYGAVVWVLLDLLVVRPWAGHPAALTPGAWPGLAGRLVWGGALGLAFAGVRALLAERRPRGLAA